MQLSTAAKLMSGAVTADDFIVAAIALIAAECGATAELYAVDHEVTQLRHLQTRTAHPLSPALLDGLTQNRPHTTGTDQWTPLASRHAPFLVARTSREDPTIDPEVGALIGDLYALRRQSRFELEQVRRRTAMSVAAELQWEILPPQTDNTNEFSVGAALRPAYKVAGDAFDYELDTGYARAYALDAMGHGITATLSASLAVTALRNSRRAGESLDAQITAAHEAVAEEWHGDRFVTAVAVQATPDDLFVVNAGHEPLRRRDADGIVTTLQIPADPPLGAPHDRSYTAHSLDPLAPGESLVLLSDGAPNNSSTEGTALGHNGVNDAIARIWSPDPFTTVHRLLAAVNDHIDHDEIDDVTAMVLVKR